MANRFLNSITVDGKIYYSNVFQALSDLPSATDYHGMFAHVHNEGAAYYAHAGNWVKLANFSDISGSGSANDSTLTVTAGTALSGGGTFTTNQSSDSAVTVNLDNTAVTPGTYGDANNTPQIVVDQQGRVTSATTVSTAGSGGGSASEAFKTIAISGQNDVVADSSTDTLTLEAGSNITLTTDASSDKITIASTASGGGGGGSSSLSIEKNVFTATANQTAFTISSSITSSSNTQVYIDGVYQAKSNYTTSGSVITFSSGVPLGAEVEVIHFIAVASKVYTDSFTGDGSDVTFDATKDITDENITQIYIDGVYQSKDNYTTSGTTITFSTAPPNSSAIEVVHFEAINYSSLASNQFTGTGSQTAFTLTQSVDVDTSFVFIQGVYQEKDQYSISGTTLTFTSAPPNGYSIEVVTVGQISVAPGTNTLFTDTFTGNGSTSTYALGITPTDLNAVEVYLNGLYQNVSTLSLSSQNLTFSTPPPSGVIIEVRSIGGLNASSTLAPATITGGTGISVVTNSANNFTINNTLIDVSVSFNAPTGQSLTYTTPASSSGQAGSSFTSTTFTITDPSGGILSGTAVIGGLPAGLTSTQSYNNTNAGNILTITLSGVYPSANSTGTNLVISNLTVSAPPLTVQYLVIGGGGSGGQTGGGGAGGYLTNFGGTPLSVSTSTNYAITVGAGGGATASIRGNSGSDSIFNNITSTGGGGGGGQGAATNSGDGYNGGSGGGAGIYDAGSGTPGNGNTPATNPSQGNNGGNDNKGSGTQWAGGGGGGAGTVGQDAPSATLGGDGGAGLANAITVASGTGPFYAAGGGGSSWNYNVGTPSAGTGGSSIGGNGGTSSAVATGGAANTGSGGGANGFTPSGYLLGNSGSGADGVVILRYPSGYQINGLSGTTNVVGNDKVTIFTNAGTGNITFS